MKQYLHRFSKSQYATSIALILLSGSAMADWLIDTGPGGTGFGGSQVYNSSPEPYYGSMAGLIHIDAATTLSQIQVWTLAYNSADETGKVMAQFALYSNENMAPGQHLYSQNEALDQTIDFAADWRGNAGLNWQVQAGDYWVVLQGIQGQPESTLGLTNMVGPTSLGLYASNNYWNGGTWQTVGGTQYTGLPGTNTGFGIRIAAVPEPATYLSMLFGLALMAGLSRVHKPVGEHSA